ncbi:MAG TPA: histidinol-phosphate transaminase, partial [Gemmatimonadales bacterium]|nr:histidinol-phosphate transaminase [Gemmatimonadales bacterium]
GFEARWMSEYPGSDGGILLPALARFLGVAESQVTIGCGSDELIDSAFGLAEPGSALIHSEPTFSMVPVYAGANRLRSVGVPLGANGGFDPQPLLNAARAAGPQTVIYLCSPNNPTGGAIPADAIRTLLQQAPGLVILDAAYAEFCDEPGWLTEAAGSERLLVLRTFSKAWGLAGLRVGYAVGGAALIARLRSNRGPFSLNAVAERVTVAALAQDGAWVIAHAREVARNRDRLLEALRALGLSPLPSSANFVLLPVADARNVAAGLLHRGIAVRAFGDLGEIGDAIRIGVGPWEVMARCLTAIREVLSCD